MSVKTWSEKALNIIGPVGNIELRLGQHKQNDNQIEDSAALPAGLIICHPHPLHLGTMDNKVVTTLVRGASRLGLDTLRFNFRGVGQSEGQYDQGRGEQDDLKAVVNYGISALGWQQVYLAGFSFGAGVACLFASQHTERIAGLFLVAPAVHHFEAPSTLPYEFESHVYMGDADEVVPFDEVEHWVDLLTPQPHFHIFEGAEHFFHGRLVELKKAFVEDLVAIIN